MAAIAEPARHLVHARRPSKAQSYVCILGLGQVHISLKLDDNLAQLQMVSPHSHVRAALEAALPMLRTQLAESGIQLGQSNISSESFAGHQQSSGQQQQSGRAQGQDIFAAEDDAILATPASLQAAARGDGSVDIFA